MEQHKPVVKQMVDYVTKRINENATDGLDISEDAWRSHARDIVNGVMRAFNDKPESGVRVVCDESNNPQYNIDNNILTIDVIITGQPLRKLILGEEDDQKTISVVCSLEDPAKENL
ncbi:hypothetical protein MPK67_gp058 [Erwinia phage pEa_SNUABM_32]|uniref:Uncharacterized protein n=2 Tax=Alexandravirus TaxID=2733088 RepID=A0AAE7XJ22_9CAUD|nr:hypothetical protein MPK67_gp058 [Erwinia phage pEa_SNUABM_32]YP_010301171.1 hypothetical protein MPK68_gp058 [Erwinia phage pEa_SNUABM_3]QZE56594.1 hypothetical protein pEaSNUABM20_00058 [Erwinia phage pEa_SNUABM_20]QZE58274.1 hypothetical protein pEaSNUABM40_00058 [Erwinia phage pEa_SNUABM_40]UAW52839.1 hypothetical protein pEaSNUABM23_00057 [Erwinia phage pEa_SNUABM_23]UIW10735.1 hypothetical protein pEaSNUABM23_00057 [Erwinia phage pEa_SNUABM_31]QZE56255.1 hypothetical protein pEaSNUAB